MLPTTCGVFLFSVVFRIGTLRVGENFLCAELQPILFGREIGALFELVGKQRRGGKTAAVRHFGNGKLGSGKQFFGIFETFADDILLGGNADGVLEDVAKTVVGVVGDRFELLRSYVLREVFVDVFDDFFQFVGAGLVHHFFGSGAVKQNNNVFNKVLHCAHIVVFFVRKFVAYHVEIVHDGFVGVRIFAGAQTGFFVIDGKAEAKRFGVFHIHVVVAGVGRYDDAVVFSVFVFCIVDIAIAFARIVIDKFVAFMRVKSHRRRRDLRMYFGRIVANSEIKMNIYVIQTFLPPLSYLRNNSVSLMIKHNYTFCNVCRRT